MYILPVATVVTVFLSGLAAGHELSRRLVPPPQRLAAQSRRLVPFSYSTRSHHPRAVKRALLPKHTMNLAYAHETASVPSTLLTFAAHEDMPIISLEDISHLLNAVLCHSHNRRSGGLITLDFASAEAATEALASWSIHPAFTLVTLHSTCNEQDQRGAWIVNSVDATAQKHQLMLDAISIPLREIGASFHLSHKSDGVSSWGAQSIDRRSGINLDPGFDKAFPFGHDFNFAPRQRLFPVDQSLFPRSTPDPDADASDPGDLQVFCVDCVSRMNFSIGVELEIPLFEFKPSAAHINLTVLEFQHEIQLEFSFNSSSGLHQSVDVVKVPLPDLGFTIPEVASIGLFFGGSFNADMDVSGGLNFSIGAKTSIPNDSSASLVLAGPGKSGVTGWNGTSFDIIPFRLNSGMLNTSAQLSLSPFLDAELDILGKALSASGRIGINTPQITAHASALSNVNRQCQNTGPSDFEFFTAALTFGAGGSLDIHASTEGDVIPDTDEPLLTQNITIGSIPPLATPECFIIADDNPTATTGGLAGQTPAPTGTLRDAASAVPSFALDKIESYFSASGSLPTNVNYAQLVQATTVPDSIKNAVDKIVGQTNGNGTKAAANSAAKPWRWDSWGLVLVGGMVAFAGF
ncbi:hypothetical protein DFH06DRAFT_344641 [Mycena polygramma]|nr:hypothetical protein DFH06DRAFT_344641 [Mycena polygramma]